MDSKTYWAKREEEALKHYIADEKAYDRELRRIYSNMLDACQNEINAFYGKYAAKEGITIAEAKKRVKKADIAAYERKAAKYVKEKDFSPTANEEMRLYNAMMKINRLEMLKANIGLELIAGHDELEKFMGSVLKGRTEEELERQAGILGKTVKNNAKYADAIVNSSFHNAKFSDRIWMYQDLLRDDLDKLLQSGMIQGKNSRVLAREVRQKFNTTTYNAERLMRTELARVQTEAQKQSFKANGFDEYIFIVNGGCCPICQGLSGKHFKVSKMMPGENAPPIHPHCRCSTAAYEDSAEYEAWLDYLSKGGTTEEWNKLKKTAEGIETAPKSGNIKSGAVSGARNPYSDKAKEHAIRYYGLVRSMTTDVAKIAKTTGMSEADIQRVKDFIFMEKHDLGGPEPEYFEPDYMMAESWKRLIEGNPVKHDRTLLQHEIMERQLMEQGMTQDEAHCETSKVYNYDKEAGEYYDKIKKYSD